MTDASPVYRVLARKYRPSNFAELIGQEALVRTLSHGIEAGRIAHAFMLTGVRGVGKTTSARIVAKALNCIGADGTGTGPTAQPCGTCDQCVSISEDRHVDVIEMDAASRTGVDDVREIIDSVKYRPSTGRYKIYIIDEVHMLSKQAFNALLKTLEEPPEHAKFIFATTEIRKVPITVLSRCQRFDLRRVDVDVLSAHFKQIADKENVQIDDDALALISRAADGSVRDGLSLLDQAFAVGGERIDLEQIQDMLGLADRGKMLDLLEACLQAKPDAVLAILDDLAAHGADAHIVIQDLLELTHELTRLTAVADANSALMGAEAERARKLGGEIGMAALSRAWQILLKGAGELNHAPLPRQTMEMIALRLVYAASLPTPDKIIQTLQTQQTQPDGPAAAPSLAGSNGSPASAAGGDMPLTGIEQQTESTPPPHPPQAYAPAYEPAHMNSIDRPETIGGHLSLATAPKAQPLQHETPSGPDPIPTSWRDLVSLFAAHKKGILYGQLYSNTRPVKLEKGKLEIAPSDTAPKNFASDIAKHLSEWTDIRWIVTISKGKAGLSLEEEDQAERQALLDRASAHPLVKRVLDDFPGAQIIDIKPYQEKDE